MFNFEFISLHGLDKDKRAEKFSVALNWAERAINSEEFELWFLSQVFRQLGDNYGRTNQEMLALVRRPVICEYYVVPRPWFKRYSSVVGWTSMIKKFIFSRGWRDDAVVSTYADEFDGMSTPGLGGHLTHEIACHGNGFGHSVKWVKDRDLSQPYLVGNWVTAWITKNIT